MTCGKFHPPGSRAKLSRCGVGEVVPFSRNHVPDAPTRIRHITGITWDDMDVHMRHGLARCSARIEPDIERHWDWGKIFE